MDLLGHIREKFRPELPVKQEILEREKKFNEDDSSRESWILSKTYLCEGGLKELKKHPDCGYNLMSRMVYYEVPKNKKGPCKKVTVHVPLSPDRAATISLVERTLKLDLNSRGCNSGVFYKRYVKDNSLYAEAVPAMLTTEF